MEVFVYLLQKISWLERCYSRMFIAYLMFGYNLSLIPANIHLLKVNNRNTRKRYEICSKLKIKTRERRHFLNPLKNQRFSDVFWGYRNWSCHGVFINFEHILHLFLDFIYYWLWPSKCWMGSCSQASSS